MNAFLWIVVYFLLSAATVLIAMLLVALAFGKITNPKALIAYCKDPIIITVGCVIGGLDLIVKDKAFGPGSMLLLIGLLAAATCILAWIRLKQHYA